MMSSDYSANTKRLKKLIARWRTDIKAFAYDNFKFNPDEWQDSAFTIFQKPETRRMSIKSGQGVGKTAFSGIIFLWFLTCNPNARVVATAPTRQQLNDVLWAELEKWRQKSPLLFHMIKWTKTYIYVVGREKRWFGVARASSKPENMQGFHEDNMLFIVDEASGVPEDVLEAILGTLSGVNNKLLLVGNPTKVSGLFYDSHTSMRHQWETMTVDSAKSSRTNKENIQALIDKYGPDSNVVRVRVHGLFPLAEDDVYIPITYVEQSILTDVKVKAIPDIIDIGCDVARFGNDKTVISYRVDGKIEIYKKRHGQDLMKTADDVLECCYTLRKKYPNFKRQIVVKIDDSGLGGGVTDRLRRVKTLRQGELDWLRIVPIIFGMKLKSNYYYHDTTTYMMSILKTLLFDENGKPTIQLPDDNDLVGQISSRKYIMTDSGKIKVESKDEMKDRGLQSPDEADSVLLAVMPVNKRK